MKSIWWMLGAVGAWLAVWLVYKGVEAAIFNWMDVIYVLLMVGIVLMLGKIIELWLTK